MKVTEKLSERTFIPVAVFEIGDIIYTAAHPVVWRSDGNCIFGKEEARGHIETAITVDLKNEGASEEQIKEVLDWMLEKYDAI